MKGETKSNQNRLVDSFKHKYRWVSSGEGISFVNLKISPLARAYAAASDGFFESRGRSETIQQADSTSFKGTPMAAPGKTNCFVNTIANKHADNLGYCQNPC